MKTKLISYLNSLKNLNNDSHQIIEKLRTCNDLSIPEKNLIYLYFFPRPLLDMELPYRINEMRGNNQSGYLEPNLPEISLIIEAYRTEQYRRYIKHLFHSFTNPIDIHPVDGFGKCNCGLCKKEIYELKSWNEICNRFSDNYKEKENKEYLSYGSTGSNISLCIDCIIQLNEAKNLLTEIEPDFLKIKSYL